MDCSCTATIRSLQRHLCLTWISREIFTWKEHSHEFHVKSMWNCFTSNFSEKCAKFSRETLSREIHINNFTWNSREAVFTWGTIGCVQLHALKILQNTDMANGLFLWSHCLKAKYELKPEQVIYNKWICSVPEAWTILQFIQTLPIYWIFYKFPCSNLLTIDFLRLSFPSNYILSLLYYAHNISPIPI